MTFVLPKLQDEYELSRSVVEVYDEYFGLNEAYSAYGEFLNNTTYLIKGDDDRVELQVLEVVIDGKEHLMFSKEIIVVQDVEDEEEEQMPLEEMTELKNLLIGKTIGGKVITNIIIEEVTVTESGYIGDEYFEGIAETNITSIEVIY